MLTTFSSIRDWLLFSQIFTTPTSSSCVWQIDFQPFMMKNQEEKEQEYMRGRGKGFKLNSKSIYIIKCLEQRQYWEERIVLPGGPGKVGEGDELKRQTLETCGIWWKKKNRRQSGISMSFSESPSWFLVSARIWIILKFLLVARVSLWPRHYSDTGQQGSLLH